MKDVDKAIEHSTDSLYFHGWRLTEPNKYGGQGREIWGDEGTAADTVGSKWKWKFDIEIDYVLPKS